MSKYLMLFVKSQVKAVLEYSSEGYLTSYQLEGEFDEEQFKFFFDRFPFTSHRLEKWRTMGLSKIRIDEIEPDLSFQHFWDEYDHKISSKIKCEKIWNKLNEADKHSALKYIAIYDQALLKTNGQAKCYAETYLNQRRWEV